MIRFFFDVKRVLRRHLPAIPAFGKMDEKQKQQMELYYSKQVEGNEARLDETESGHLARVMRHRPGDVISLTNGEGNLFEAVIVDASPKSAIVKLLQEIRSEAASPLIHIAIAPTKNIDRFEWFLEKATELGVTEISPLITRRSEREKLKHDRLQKILISAMKQSLRLRLPKLNEMASLQNFLLLHSSGGQQKLIAHCRQPDLSALKKIYQPNAPVILLIGPEGDFTADEITLAEENRYVSVSLGKARLRTETAGLVALHTIQLLNS
jgi:16S rRNA (uracil1498-N3)-methyltransferase